MITRELFKSKLSALIEQAQEEYVLDLRASRSPYVHGMITRSLPSTSWMKYMTTSRIATSGMWTSMRTCQTIAEDAHTIWGNHWYLGRNN